MKQNRITVFNCVIDKRIEDCSFFEDLLDNHYHKFSYGYNIVAQENLLEKVKDIECDIYDKKLKFIITFKKSITKKIMKLIDESRESVYGSERFDADVDFSADNIVTLRIYKR
jgi:hypothetical protein